MRITIIALLFALCAFSGPDLWSQVAVTPSAAPLESGPVEVNETPDKVTDQNEDPLTFPEFLRAVTDHNVSYAAQKYNVSIAQAQVSLARLWPNPVLSAGYNTAVNQQNSVTINGVETSSVNSLSSSYTAGISQTIPLGGKLSAKEQAAQANVSVASAQLDDFFRTLRATAAGAYIDSLTAQLVVKRKQETYRSLKELADLNEVRFKDGDIAESDYLTARIAAVESLNDLRVAQTTLRQSTIGLAQLVGKKLQRRVYHPVGTLELSNQTFDEEKLVERAVANRSDVRAAQRQREYAEAEFRVTKSNRVSDLTVSLNFTHNTASQNSIAATPANDQVGGSVQIPLPLTNFNTDDLKTAGLALTQAEKNLEAAEIQAETDVRQGLDRYRAAHDTVQQFSKGILQDAQHVYDITLYSYKKGKASLLDVRQAQSDLSNTYQDYYSALNEQAKAAINLEQAADLWDLEF